MSTSKFGNHHLVSVLPAIVIYLLSIHVSMATDIGAGEKIFNTGCVSCHGSKAQGNDALGGPALAGQHEVYLIRQLAHFSQGVRGANESDSFGKQMAAMSLIVKDSAAQENVSSYLASLDKPTTLVTDAKTGNGNKLGYKTYQASCGACHGPDASGNERLNSPNLAGLSRNYLSRQYTHFLDGTRGSHQSDKLGRQMAMISNTLKDSEKIEAVLDYIVSLQE